MKTLRTQALVLSVFSVALGSARPAHGADPESDSLSNAWAGRAALATKKLAEKKLDACDKAVEVAFQHPEVNGVGGDRMFVLNVKIGDAVLAVSYSYKKGRLATFGIVDFPSNWRALQKADIKTFTVLLGVGKCAFDLCTNDPFADGPCAEPKPGK